jgi:peptidoglycan/xylan/chitin deacetylase (PgdA/CDA1 family)
MVLLFHRVCPKEKGKRMSVNAGMEVTPGYLEDTVKFFIKNKYKIISLDKLHDILKSKSRCQKFVVFTLDDGYTDNLVYAYPIFKKYNIPFTIYVTAGFADRKAVLWWYSLEDMVLNNSQVAFRTQNRRFEFVCGTDAEKAGSFAGISGIIRDSNERSFLENIEQIFGPYGIDMYKKTRELTLGWEEVRQLSADPLVAIGAHTLNHYCLANLSEPAAKREMLESKKMLESHIDGKVRHFSYPFGSKNEAGARDGRIAKECGFETAATTRAASIFFAHRDYLESLPRITMGEEVDGRRLNFLINGFTQCVRNNFKRVVTF